MAYQQLPNQATTSPKVPNVEPYYNYKPLPDGWIRLLRIQKTSSHRRQALDIYFEKDLHVSIEDHCLATCPAYIALSYTWGEPTVVTDPTALIFTTEPRCYPIYCEGQLLRGTRNLRTALRRLRQSRSLLALTGCKTAKFVEDAWGEVELYWIDALCVDQDDLLERSKQVSLMAKIYGQARSCTVYLGEEDEYSRSAMDLIQAFCHDVAISQCLVRCESGRAKDLILCRMDSLTKEQKNGLSVLLARRYFSRVWVLQEMILARKVLGLFGPIVFDFEIVLSFGSLCSIAARDFTIRGLDDFTIGKTHYPGHDHSVPSPHQAAVSLGALMNARMALQQKRPLGFLDVVPTALICDTSDERDRIYGILAVSAELLHDHEPSIVVDYNRPVGEVYANATASLARRRNDLEFLSLVGEQNHMKTRDLPTWCPDYSTRYFWIRDPGGSSQWHLGPIWPLPPNIDFENDRILVAEGMRYDTLAGAAIAELPESSDSYHNPIRRAKPRDLLALIASLPMAARAEKLSTETTPRLEMLWRLLFMDDFLNQSPAPLVTGLFLPHIIVQMLYNYFKVQGSDSIISKESFVTKELASLERMIDGMRRLEPRASPFLPDISAIKAATMELDVSLVHLALLDSLPRRAADAGLASELKAIIPSESGRGDRAADVAWLSFLQREVFAQIKGSLSKQSYFSTAQHGRIGIGYSSIEVGDEIWLLNGHSAPVILRQLPNGNYLFLGEAYLQGIMRGELAEKPRCADFQVQRIRIE